MLGLTLFATLTTETLLAPPAFGDRGQDPTIAIPDALLVQNGGNVINLKRPPEGIRPAKGDGKADDTEAIRDAYDFILAAFKRETGWSNKNGYVMYFPAGTYRVSDTLIYRGKTVGAFPNWDGTFDFNRVRLLGEQRGRTTIRLADQTAGFTDPNQPKAVVATQHPDTVFNNLPGANWIRNLTIDVGSGNSGAVGLDFQGANNTDMRHVTIRASEGSGYAGVLHRIGSIQGYYADVTIEGFRFGVSQEVNPEGQPSYEYLTLLRQREAAIRITAGGLGLRRVLSTQTTAAGVLENGRGIHWVAMDSEFRGPAFRVRPPDVQLAQYLVRNVRVNDKLIQEEISRPAFLLGTSSAGSPVIPPADAPLTPYPDRITDWAVVKDEAELAAALERGASHIALRGRTIAIKRELTVKARTKLIHGWGGRIEGAPLVVAEGAGPLVLQDVESVVVMRHPRPLVARCFGMGIVNDHGKPSVTYLENVNDCATGDRFCPPGAKIFARQIDIEYANADQIVNAGGQLWIFGFKTENGSSGPFTVAPGGITEVFSGYCNAVMMAAPAQQRPLIRVAPGGRFYGSFFTNLGGIYTKGITYGDEKLTWEVFPKRGYDYAEDISIPLLVVGKGSPPK